MTSRSRRYARWFVAGIVLLALTPACYTLFDHPRLAQLNYERPNNQRCMKCHDGDALWAMLQPQRRAAHTGPWRTFYDEPWWFAGRVIPPDTTAQAAPAAGEKASDGR